MKIGFALYLSPEINRFTNLFTLTEDKLNEFFVQRESYGEGLQQIYIGLVCVSEQFEQFFKPKKSKYTENKIDYEENGQKYSIEKTLELSIKLDFSKFNSASISEAAEILKTELLDSLVTFDQMAPKIKFFDMEKFKKDFKELVQNLEITASVEEEPKAVSNPFEKLAGNFDAAEFLSLATAASSKQPSSLSDKINLLEKFIQTKKFEDIPLDKRLSSSNVVALNEALNASAKKFKAIAEAKPSPKKYWDAIKHGLDSIDGIRNELSSEVEDRICAYFEELMDAVELQSSEGVLNKWRYGFDPTARA